MPLAYIQGQKFDLQLNRLTQRVAGVTNFDELPIPTAPSRPTSKRATRSFSSRTAGAFDSREHGRAGSLRSG